MEQFPFTLYSKISGTYKNISLHRLSTKQSSFVVIVNPCCFSQIKLNLSFLMKISWICVNVTHLNVNIMDLEMSFGRYQSSTYRQSIFLYTLPELDVIIGVHVNVRIRVRSNHPTIIDSMFVCTKFLCPGFGACIPLVQRICLVGKHMKAYMDVNCNMDCVHQTNNLWRITIELQ